MLGRLGGNMVDLSGRDIPRLAASRSYPRRARASPAKGPALLAARSERRR